MMTPAVLNRRLHGTLVAGIDIMQWATSDSTDYVAADTRHHCSQSAECCLLQHWCGHYRYTCSHSTGTPVAMAFMQSSGVFPALPLSVWGTVMRCRRRDSSSRRGGEGHGTMHTPSLHIPLLCPTLYPIPAWAHWLDRRSTCWRDWSYLIAGLCTGVARWCM